MKTLSTKITESLNEAKQTMSLDAYKKATVKALKNKTLYDDLYDEMLDAFTAGIPPAKFAIDYEDGLNESLNEAKSESDNDWLKAMKKLRDDHKDGDSIKDKDLKEWITEYRSDNPDAKISGLDDDMGDFWEWYDN